jgi:hypothetical protein
MYSSNMPFKDIHSMLTKIGYLWNRQSKGDKLPITKRLVTLNFKYLKYFKNYVVVLINFVNL